MKILTVVGVRPQFVKAAALSREIRKHPEISEILVHTGQHFDKGMSEVFFEEMGIAQPNYNLGINGLTHGAMTGQMLEGLERIMMKEGDIDRVVVYGDTNSTLAGALAAKKLNIKVAHVEAGLRSHNPLMPEEINRVVTDRISDYLFCPTETAVDNLKIEGYPYRNCSFFNSGDVMQDAANYYSKISEEKSSILDRMSLQDFVLCTIHRQENTDSYDRLKGIADAINKISKNIEVVIPLHPRTKKALSYKNIEIKATIIPPVSYFDMIELIKKCKLVMTDSGGLQKEAFFFKKKSIVLRNQTEWVEIISSGQAFLSGANYDNIVTLFNLKADVPFSDNSEFPGGGKACENIVNKLKK
jgi:UDP-GlcNAc3NAcA epimerase